MTKPEGFSGVSVIIPSHNEEKYISRCIRSLVEGNESSLPLEILVINGQSTDKTPEIVTQLRSEFQCVKLIDNPLIETQHALNLGVKSAKHSHVMIAGAHSEYPPSYIEIMLKYMAELEADGTGGALKTDVLNKTRVSVAIMRILSHPVGVGNSKFRTGASKPLQVDTVPFGVYKKSLFDQVGYYHTELKRNHDMEWSKRLVRAGKSVWLIPNVKCTYYARETFSGLAVNNYQNGLWNILAVAITGTLRSLSLRHFIPLCFVMSLVASAIAGVFYFPVFYLTAVIAVSYLLIISFFSCRLSGTGTGFFHVLWAFMVLHFAYGTGSMIGLLKSFPLFFRKKNKKCE